LSRLEWDHLQTITIVLTVINNCSKQLGVSNLNTPPQHFIVSHILLNTLHFSIFFKHKPTQLLRFLFDYGWYNWVARETYLCNISASNTSSDQQTSIDQFRYIKIHTWLKGLGNKTKEIILRLSNE